MPDDFRQDGEIAQRVWRTRAKVDAFGDRFPRRDQADSVRGDIDHIPFDHLIEFPIGQDGIESDAETALPADFETAISATCRTERICRSNRDRTSSRLASRLGPRQRSAARSERPP